ncbi:MAG: cadmium-translocating P-type ATPase [Lachnospiraceae bacterium]|nr:cadmium-translocating P-type ATPase [Lachnospiraceae bacterium]
MNKKQKKMLVRIIIAVAALIILAFIPWGSSLPWVIARFILYTAVYLEIGYDILINAFKGIKNGQLLDENFLMAVATVGAYVLAIYSRSGDYLEAIAVMLFYQIGELFQGIALGKSRRSISDLMDIRPDTAILLRDGEQVTVDPDEVATGSEIIVRAGDKVPIDGVIIQGSTTLDTAALTGESMPREAAEGDTVLSGCINLTGTVTVRTTREFGESTASKILELVENSSSNKSRSENFITRFARVYTPAVCITAAVLAVIPPIISGTLLHLGFTWSTWIYRALTFLVISCPCALVISIPLTFFAGIGGASRAGVLVKGSNYLEALSKTACVVMDKTGTLTLGRFKVTDISSNSIESGELLKYAAAAEQNSTHPIARCLCERYNEEFSTEPLPAAENVAEHGGMGVSADISGHRVYAGNHKLMDQYSIKYDIPSTPGTCVYVAIDGVLAGCIVMNDTLKPGSANAINTLRRMNINRIVMLTGDNHETASRIAGELGIKDHYSNLMPEDKVSHVEKLLAEKPSGKILTFVGDGINDAPVLSLADVGIAMGALGSDAAIEAADIVLMDDDPMGICRAIRISRKCMRIVYENIYFAIGVKLICLLLGAIGIANMWLAIFADVGVMVIAVLNAIRALSVKKG